MATKNYLSRPNSSNCPSAHGSLQQGAESLNLILESSNSLLTLLFDNSEHIFILLDKNYCIQFITKKSQQLFTVIHNIDIQIGINLLSVVSKERHPFLKEICIDVLNGNNCETESVHEIAGKKRCFKNQFRPAIDKQKNIVGIIITSQDITATKTNHLTLEEEQLHRQLASEGGNQGLWYWNIPSGHVHYSKSYKHIYGFEDHELESHINELRNRIHPDDRATVEETIKQFFSNKDVTLDFCYRILHKDGQFKWIIASGVIVSRDEMGNPIRMIGTHTDITGYKNTETNYKLLFYSSPLPMWTCDLETLQFLEVNDCAVQHYGYSREEFQAMNINDLYPQNIREERKNTFEKNKNSFYFTESKVQHQKKDGAIIYVDIKGHIIEQGHTKISLVTCQDITDKLHAELHLLDSEIKYRTLFLHNPLPCWIYHTKTQRILEVNNAAERHYGYTKEEFKQLTIVDIHPPDERETIVDTIKQALQKETGQSTYRHQKKNGDIICVEIRSSTITYQDKEARLVVIHDKTEQVLTENELLISNERFRLAAKASSDVLWEWNVLSEDMYISQGFEEMFGWKLKEKTMFNDRFAWMHPEDKQEAIRTFHASLANPFAERWQKEYRLRRADGSYANIIDKVYIQRDEKGKALKVVGAIQNITQQKKTEESLRISNERYEFVSKATSDAIWDLNLTDNTLEWGEGLTTLFGYKGDDVSYENWIKLVHPDDAKRVEESLLAAIDDPEQNNWRSQYRFRHINGNYRYVLDRGFILRDENKVPYRFIGALQDITDLKIKEKELIKSNDRYKYVSLATADIIYDWNIKKDTVLLSDNFHKVFGWELPSDHKLTSIECIAHVHPEDAERIKLGIYNSINDKKDKNWDTSFRYAKANGVYAYVTIKGYIIRNKQGEAIRVIGAIQDVTAIKIKEQQLTESHERFNAVLKATNDLIWDWNLETGVFYRDIDGIRKVYGVENDTDIKNIYAWLQRIHPEDYNRVQNAINDILHATDEDTFEVEYRFKRDDNRYNFVYDRGIILRNAEGKPVRMIGAAQNITERKRLELQLLKKELDKQKLISQATIETQEQERSEIGKELHDNVNQVLTTTKLYLDLSISNAELKDELIEKSSKNIIYVINEIRQLSRSLMNPSLGDLGLIESVTDLIENINLTGRLKATLKADESLENGLTENQKLMIYRITQEAINNALKHAKAKNVQIKLLDSQQWVELIIEDDGIGFNFDTVKKGSGLKHIQNRVYLANGTLTIETALGKGCHILINFPKHTTNPN